MHMPHQKLHPKNPVGKTVLREKSAYQPHFVLHMLPHQKPYVRNLQVKTHKEKKSTTENLLCYPILYSYYSS
jgi:hypothetical protein